MISTLETGHFIWNFSAWFKIFFLFAGIFCLLTFVIKRSTGGSLISNKTTLRYNDDIEDDLFMQKVSLFRSKIIKPWFDFPFSHILSLALLFLLFAVALFSKNGVE